MFRSSVLALVVLALPAFADAPATVLEHKVQVRVDAGRRLTSNQTWVVRIDDPAGCAAGLIAPSGLDGAVDGEALVLEDLLIVPATAQKGDVFTLTATTQAPRGFHSGVFSTAPDLPVEKAEVQIAAPATSDLTFWADPKGDPNWNTRSGKTATITWQNVPPEDPARVVWSTWGDWQAAGDELEKAVDTKMASKNEMGRDMAADLKSSNLAELARRVFQLIKQNPGETGTWETARSAAQVIEEGSGSAAERGVVLISLLRAAGYEARPATFRSARTRGTFPITVPGPAMLTEPLVQATDRAGRTIWIDPSGDYVSVPSLPSSLMGATVWVPGDLPTTLMNETVVDGTVVINTSAKIDGKGNVTWSASIDATGTGMEWIRRRLGPLDDDGQQKALKRLANQARPNLDRFAITSSGTKDPYKPLKITVSGHDDGVFKRFGAGMRGEIAPVMAPAMAAWLPPKIRVQEFIDISGPSNLLIVANTHPSPAYDPDALIDRNAERAGPRLRMSTEVERPYSTTTSSRDAAASRFLAEQAPIGVEVLLFPPTSPAVVKSLATTDLPEAERVALEALLWFQVENRKKAGKIMKTALGSMSVDDLAPQMASWLDKGDNRPWVVLRDMVDIEQEKDRVAIMRAMDRYGFKRLAWTEGAVLAKSPEPDTSAEGLLSQLANQPLEKPDPTKDEEGAEAWTAPDEILKQLSEKAGAAGGDVEDRARLAIADWTLTHGGDAEEALNLLPNDTPQASALHLTQFAATFPNATVVERAAKLSAQAPSDPIVAGHLANAMSRIGRFDDALEYGLAAARLAHDDPDRWVAAADHALTAGRLHLALEAARRASDLEPTNVAAAKKLHQVATLALDDENEALGRQRAGLGERVKGWPLTVDELMAVAPPTALLALLQYHEADVVASPVMLGIRAQLRTEAGLFDEAARDSINLARLHGEADGSALAFSATAGRVFGTGALSLLDAVDTDVARLTRMEYRLLTGSQDARQDARLLKDEPRAEAVLLTAGSPADAVAQIEGWPTDLTEARVATPAGYKVNPILSAPTGVSGFSQSDRQLAVLHINTETDLLPPPLALLYSPREPLLAKADGVELIRLDGGNLPLYAARRKANGATVLGLGFTEEAARRALADFQ
ncbi:MAG: hypothetical protein H6737_03285 [Alphaproteobacteria bacterium]|nr:hypothetical protein [Alphaproteobacteria bacterium]